MIFTKNKIPVIDRKNESIAAIHLISEIVAIFCYLFLIRVLTVIKGKIKNRKFKILK